MSGGIDDVEAMIFESRSYALKNKLMSHEGKRSGSLKSE